MEYELEYAGRTYSLPKFTKSVRKEIERIDADNESTMDNDKKYLGMYTFVKKMIGEDAARQIYESDNIEEIDLNVITISFLGIGSAYDKPITDMTRNTSVLEKYSSEDKELILETIRNAGNIQNMDKVIRNQQTKANSNSFMRGMR